MRTPEGNIRFCEGCPAAGAARGDIKRARATDPIGPIDLLAPVQGRVIRIEGQNGGLSVPIDGDAQNYTRDGDMQRVFEMIGNCAAPRVDCDTERAGVWPFRSDIEVQFIACQAIRKRRRLE